MRLAINWLLVFLCLGLAGNLRLESNAIKNILPFNPLFNRIKEDII